MAHRCGGDGVIMLTIVELRVQAPGTYLLVDHSLGRVVRGAVGALEVEGPGPRLVGTSGGGNDANDC